MATFTRCSPVEAQALLDRYGRGRLIRLEGIAAGSVNSNYRLEVARPDGRSETLFLRIYEEQDAGGAAWDCALTTHLGSAGVPTPAPLGTLEGDSFVLHAGKPAALFPFVAGVHACQASVSPARAHAVGRALGEVHAAAASFADRRASRFSPEQLRHRLPKIAAANDPAIATLAPELGAALDGLLAEPSFDVPRGIVHGDLFRDNVLFAAATGDREAEVVALLDFESAAEGALIFDLAVCLHSWCFGDRFEVALGRALLDGYTARRPLEHDERGALEQTMRSSAIRFCITRLTDYALREGVVGDRVMKDWRRFYRRHQLAPAFVAALFDDR
jgi:homoserine kinase type II